MSRTVKEQAEKILAHWHEQLPLLEDAYGRRTDERIELLLSAAEQLQTLVEGSGTEVNRYTNKTQYVLEPNNYAERIDFIRERKTSHYSLIQLAMLYDEVKKKAARIRVQQR